VPDEIAWRLDPGTDLVVQLHIQPSGRPETIAPRMGLSFTDRPAERRPYQVRLGARTLDIPAGAQSYAATDSYVLPVDVDVLGLLPHTHYLGKTIHLTATRPDGTTDKLLSIPDWDFNWQDEYRFTERVPLPAGTTLAVRFSWDNSAANVRNPHDPPRRVVFGPRATDEMGDLWIQVLTADESARAVLDEDFSRKEARAILAMYEKMVERDPDDVDVQYEFATVLLVQGRTDEAVDRLGRVLALEPDHAPAHGALGRILFDAGRSAEALSQFDRAIAGLPDVAELHYNRGQSLRALGRTDEALAAYDAALERDESLAAAWLATGDLLLAEGRADEAVGRYRRAIEADPSYAEAHNNLGTVLAARGRLDEAIEQFRQAVEASPTYAPAYNNLGMAFAAQGRLDDAVAALSTAVRLRPGHAGSQQNLARALALRERRGEATTR
jgi:tetratricopeptide (TPR) repeat protein